MSEMTAYVVGFMLDDTGRVALIRKNRPRWQAGRLNGIGGHVEAGESPHKAMQREFHEETGVPDTRWSTMLRMDFPGAVIDFYRAFADREVLDALRTTTDEEVVVAPLADVLREMHGPLTPNLIWLLPLAGYRADEYAPFQVSASVAEEVGSPWSAAKAAPTQPTTAQPARDEKETT